jgi:hypothetical protein
MSDRSSQTIKSIQLLAGSFTFAFLLGEMVHEYGHYLRHRAYGNLDAQVHLDPFGGSRIVGVIALPVEVMGVTSAAGPLFDLILGITCTLLLWWIRNPKLLPLLLWGPVAMVQEGVTFSLGLLTPGGDAQWIVAAGIPQPIVLATGLLLLTTGIATITLLFPLAGIKRDDPFGRKVLIVMAGICSLMLLRSAHSWLVSPESSLENLIPLLFSLLLALILVSLHKPITRAIGKITTRSPVTWSVSVLALILGISMFTFQVLALN